MEFDGVTYEAEHDRKRLTGLALRVFTLMSDGSWRTLSQIRDVVGGSEAGISARLRDFRKPRFGGHTVERERQENPAWGLYRYQLIPRPANPPLGSK